MPGLSTMTEDKKATETPVVFTEVMSSAASKPRNTKKYVIIAVSGILSAAIILTAILVGMYMFTEAQKEIIQYTLKMNENTKQDVTSDPNENVVKYHVSSPSQEAWVVNDFNRDIQLLKIVSEGTTNCYLSPLNRTDTVDPSKINKAETNDVKDAVTLTYYTSDTPVTDTSFLSKTARETCKGISVYWLYPRCTEDSNDNATEVDDPKTKRSTTFDNSPFYIRTYSSFYSRYSGRYHQVPCYTGCCRKVCACSIKYLAYLSGGRMFCVWVTKACPPVFRYTLLDTCTRGPRGIVCPNRYPAYPPTC